MSHGFDVAVARSSRRTDVAKGMFCVHAVAGEGGLDFFVDDDENLDTLFCFSLEKLVQSPLLVVVWRTAQELSFMT
jgi:hypothetical protein